jgi:hypothetical protein
MSCFQRKPKRGFLLVRFTVDELEVGDTWHLTIVDAKYQSDCEFDGIDNALGDRSA